MHSPNRESEARSDSVRSRNDQLVIWLIIAGLAALVWIAFGRTIHNGFVAYDDNEYVYENPNVAAGLSLTGIVWAFTHTYAANWHPLTTISHMLDCQIYGLNPWGHHLTNVLLHATGAILLFLALLKLTRPVAVPDVSPAVANRWFSIWPSAFVAAIFAVHPLRVESVAWISERKDVLSGVFFMLTILAYAAYAKNEQRPLRSYLTTILLFALGLLCKPTLVTLPFVLLLLDYWPLGRFAAESLKQLVWEKIPFFILSAGACVATVVAQSSALEMTNNLTLIDKSVNAVLSYNSYLAQLFYPVRLAPMYPYPGNVSVLYQFVPAFLLLLIISVLFFRYRTKYPFLLVGWLWFLGTLIPMIGLMQVGSQAHADRYSYLTQIGLYILITWGAITMFNKWRRGRILQATLGLLIVSVFTVRSQQETSYWKDTITLWNHALTTTSNNAIAHNNLGHALTLRREFATAISHFREAIRLRSDYAEAYNNLANALLDTDQVALRSGPVDPEHLTIKPNNTVLDEAVENYQKALAANPNFAPAWINLGTAFLQKGQVDQAVEYFRKGIDLEENLPEAHGNFGNALLEQGKIEEAAAHYERAIALKPNYADAHYGLSKTLIQSGKPVDAMKHLQQVIAIEPNYGEAYQNIAVILAQQGELDGAIDQYRKAIELKPDYALAENNLGNALLRKGKIDDGIFHLQRALRLDPDYPEACNDLGNAFMFKNDSKTAIGYYEQAVKLSQGYAEAQSNLGTALFQSKEIDQAIGHYKAAVTLKPDSAVMNYNLANALVAKGDLETAMTYYEAAVKSRPNYAEAHSKMGTALAAMHKKDEAIAEFDEALQINPNLADAHYNLGHLLAELGRHDDAVKHLSEAVRLKPNYVDAKEQLHKLGVNVTQ